ncbi:MAG: hypothetical protein Q9163_005684 [Psora crenata]
MMALKSPLMASPNNNLMSAFSPYSDSPTSPQRFDSPVHRPMSSDISSHLHPPHHSSPLAASSPSDIADPSPIATSSNGTDTTDIDDTAIENEDADATPEPPKSAKPGLELETVKAAAEASRPRSDEDDQPSSVIHAPQGFDAFVRIPLAKSTERLLADQAKKHRRSPPSIRRSTPTPSQRSDIRLSRSPASPPPLQTSVAPVRDCPDIPEAHDYEYDSNRTPNPNSTLFDHTVERLKEQDDEVGALHVALSECWTLCNTLAGLSYVHRERIFSFSGKGDRQEQAWKSCWKLCQKLYETRDEEVATQVRPTLDLCRDFCQCLFEVRQREHDGADSVLRVSFELNNHLYNTHDRTLPEAFRERTLDFYITLCHRLMKQRSELARETDSLLGACWSLAEMLFSLRQNRREGKPADEELLGSAVQACWELCDLFREGWTQIRPDRGTPRPSQTTFTQAFHQAKQSQSSSSFAELPETDESEDEDFGRLNPETPTTVFEDTQQMSPDEGPVPNILVLGPSDQITRDQQALQRKQPQWSSSSSTLSGYSQSSGTSASSTSTIIHPAHAAEEEDPHLTCLKLLIVKAAANVGYQRQGPTPLSTFVKSIPSNSFGTQSWQVSLLDSYKKLVASDPGFRSPGPVRRARAVDVARSVRWMVSNHGQYSWLRDLFRLVFGFHVEEGERRGDAVIQS